MFFRIKSNQKKEEKQLAHSNKKAMLKQKQAQNKALEKLDKMVEEIYDNDLAGMMCPLDFGALLGPPPSSRSDGNICLRGAQR